MLLIEYIFSNREDSSGLKLFSDGRVELVEPILPIRTSSSYKCIARTIGIYGMLPERAQTLAQKLDDAGFFRFRADHFPSFMSMTDFYERITLNNKRGSKTVCCHGRRPDSAVYVDVAEELRNYLVLLGGIANSKTP